MLLKLKFASNRWVLAMSLAIAAAACTDQKAPFSPQVFEVAKAQCQAKDAYIMADHPKTISFKGTLHDHLDQAKCLKERLRETDVQQIVVLGSELHDRSL